MLILWLSAWFFLSDADIKTAEWISQTATETSAEAGFRLEKILIEGRVNTDPDLLKALINMEKGDPSIAFHPNSARELIEKISWVEQAVVERRLPDTIYIRLTERPPFALWQKDGKVQVIDRQGVVLSDHIKPEYQILPLVTGKGANQHAAELIDLLRAEPLIQEATDAAVRIGDRRWDLSLNNGLNVKLPENDIGLALRRLAKSHKEDQLFKKDITEIDLREPDRLIVKRR